MSFYAAYCMCGECILLTDKRWNEFIVRKHPFSPLYSAYVVDPVHIENTNVVVTSEATPHDSSPTCSVFFGVLKDRSGPVYVRHDTRKYEKMFRYKCPHCELMIAYSQDSSHPEPLYLMSSMIELQEVNETIS